MTSRIRRPDAAWLAIGVVLTATLAVAAYYVMSKPASPGPNSGVVAPPVKMQPAEPVTGLESDAEFVSAGSETELKEWLALGPEAGAYYGGMMGRGMMVETMAVDFAEAAPAMDGAMVKAQGIGMGGGQEADRYSSTNVQVMGIDEPDRVKTDGSRIFYAPERRYWPMYRTMTGVMMDADVVSEKMFAPDPSPVPPKVEGAMSIQAFPLEDLEVLGQLDHTGELLLSGKTLMVFDYDGVYGYDVTDSSSPALSWEYQYAENNQLEAARLMGGDLYLVTRSYLNRSQPCPVRPLTAKAGDVTIPCAEVWHRAQPSEADTTFAVVSIDPASGQVGNHVAFVGSGNQTNVAMFPKNLYVATGLSVDTLDFMTGFLNDNADLVPAETLARLNRTVGYDISLSAKQAELSYVIERWLGGLSDDERLRVESEVSNRMQDYWWKHAREIGGTGVVRIDTGTLAVEATGRVPGSLLNQFSLDEHNGDLRVAVTVGGRNNPLSWQFGIGRDDSVSDVYVLDEDLKTVGSATGMGEGERIYSVRFIGDRGYVVTFRETDPFYVLDLSNPRLPKITGELKIPGYSSYLHPLADHLILGVGKEGSQVKLSMFDVSDPAAPAEVAKYSLDEYWSDVLGTHHAFLQDAKHSVFFMPGSKGGYVFSYDGGALAIKRAVSGVQVNRAVYINDYLYLISDEELRVLDETSWKDAAKLKLR